MRVSDQSDLHPTRSRHALPRLLLFLLAVLVATSTVHAGMGTYPWFGFLQPFIECQDSLETYAVGEFNGDGIPDVAAAFCPWSQQLHTYLGNGDGTFRHVPDWTEMGLFPGRVEEVDVNRDGLTDLAFWDEEDNRDLTVLVASPDGWEILRSEHLRPSSHKALGFFDRDDHIDVMTLFLHRILYVSYGTGGLSFEYGSRIPGVYAEHGFIVEDLDGDGLDDLAVISGYREISILRSRGDRTFRDPDLYVMESDWQEVTDIHVSDIDGDGRLDLVPTGYGETFTEYLRNMGDGRFEHTTLIEYTTLGDLLDTGDLDGDGGEELIALSSHEPFSLLIAEDPPSAHTDIRTELGPRQIVDLIARDLNRDGRSDLVVFHQEPAGFTSILTREDGSLVRPLISPVQDGAWPWLEEVDDDHRLDLLTVEPTGNVGLAYGMGGGRFLKPLTIGCIDVPHDPVADALRADLDGDGLADFALSVTGEKGRGIHLLRNTGEDRYEPFAHLVPSVRPGPLAAADVNSDGIIDLMVGDTVDPMVHLYPGLGGGAFGPALHLYSACLWLGVDDLETADLDRDGAGEVLAVQHDSECTVIWEYTGGEFWFDRPRHLEGSGQELVTEDLDGDGWSDILVRDRQVIRTFWNDGHGGFPPFEWFPLAASGNSMISTDLDGDDLPEIVVSETREDDRHGRIEIVEWDRHRIRPPSRSFGDLMGEGPSRPAAGDVNGDGGIDLVVSGGGTSAKVLLHGGGAANRPPVADAGPDIRAECTSSSGTPILLDGNGSSDPDGDRLLYYWSSGLYQNTDRLNPRYESKFYVGTRTFRLHVWDGEWIPHRYDGTYDSYDTVIVEVVDTTPPAGTISAPEPGTCHGPDRLPVVVADTMEDVCDSRLNRVYEPGPGPEYTEHGDYQVVLTARDDAGNEASAGVAFTIDTVAPQAAILPPSGGSWPAPGGAPLALLFESDDDDGAAGGVLHERLLLDGCPVYDGATYGNGDGLLSDETVLLSLAELCRIAGECGFTRLEAPVFRFEASDCGGNTGFDEWVLPGSLSLFPGICGN